QQTVQQAADQTIFAEQAGQQIVIGQATTQQTAAQQAFQQIADHTLFAQQAGEYIAAQQTVLTQHGVQQLGHQSALTQQGIDGRVIYQAAVQQAMQQLRHRAVFTQQHTQHAIGAQQARLAGQ